MEKILKQSKRFMLGICNCGCKQSIPIRNRRKELARYMKGHNVAEFVKHGPEHPSWKGGRSHDKNGYVLVWCPNHPRNLCNNYVHEHILVMEEFLGRHLTDNEMVHHKNEIRDDNRLENLQVMTEHEHKSYHVLKMWREGKYNNRLKNHCKD